MGFLPRIVLLAFADLPMPQIACFALGAATAIYGMTLRERATATRRWPAVRGRVRRAAIHEEVEYVGPGAGGPPLHRPEIAYEYAVGEREYVATRVDLLDRAASWRGFAEGVLARYPEGREVTVYYDPEDPRQAVLERDTAPGWATAMIVIGTAVALGSLGWAYLASRLD